MTPMRPPRHGNLSWLRGCLGAGLLGAAILAIGGCSKDRKEVLRSDPAFMYPDLSTPQNAVLNVKYAWERKDSVRTRQIYADAYQGSSTDPDGTLNFTKDAEVAAVAGLARDPNVATVTFTLPPENTWVRTHYNGDPANRTAIQLLAFSVMVDDVARGTLMATNGAGGLFEFKMDAAVDHTSPTDTTWQIVRWTEVKN